MTMRNKIISIVVSILLLISLVLYYSYTNVEAEVSDFKLGDPAISISSEKISIAIISALISNEISIPLLIDVINGVNLDINMEIKNNGLIPIEIKSVKYQLYINEIDMGFNQLDLQISVPPGASRTLNFYHLIKRESLIEAVASMVESGGSANISIDGEATVSLLGINMTLPFYKKINLNLIEIIRMEILNKVGVGPKT